MSTMQFDEVVADLLAALGGLDEGLDEVPDVLL